MGPVNWIDEKILTPLANRSLRYEASAVRDGMEGEQRVYWHMLIRLAAVALGVLLYDIGPRLVQDLLFAALCGTLAMFALSGMVRVKAYKRGWLEGRQRMVATMREHQRRGSSMDDWLDTEWHYDTTHVQGLPPLPPPRGPME